MKSKWISKTNHEKCVIKGHCPKQEILQSLFLIIFFYYVAISNYYYFCTSFINISFFVMKHFLKPCLIYSRLPQLIK